MKDYKKIAEDFARHLRAKYGEDIQRVILYGSVARGDYREESDVDMLVVAHNTSWAFRLKLAADAAEVLMREGVYISAKPVEPTEFARLKATLFGRNVRREGLLLA